MYAAFFIEEIDNGYLVKFRMGYGEESEVEDATVFADTLGDAYRIITIESQASISRIEAEEDVQKSNEESLLF